MLQGKLSEELIDDKLKQVPDPELGISIVDLGLIYGVDIKKTQVTVRMTLTTIGCPLFSLISAPIIARVKEIEGVKDVEVELTFDPPWTPERMSEAAKIHLGFA